MYKKDIENAKKNEPEMAKIAYEGTELINKLQKENTNKQQAFSIFSPKLTQRHPREAEQMREERMQNKKSASAAVVPYCK